MNAPVSYFSFYDLYLTLGLGFIILTLTDISARMKKEDRDKPFALGVLFCFTLPLLDHLIKPDLPITPYVKPVLYVTRNIYYLTGPLLWAYTLTLLKKREQRYNLFLLHALPFVCWVLLSIFIKDVFVMFPLIRDGRGMPPPGPVAYRNHILSLVRDAGSVISPIVYGIWSLRALRIHRLLVQDFYSNRETTNTLSWLRVLVLGIIVISGIAFAALIFGQYVFRSILPASQLRSAPTVLFVFFFAYFSRIQSIPENTRSGFERDGGEKYKNSSLDLDRMEYVYEILLKAMTRDKLYLDADINLNFLSEELNITRHHLSQTINRKTGGNFYNFINKYRLDEFKEAMETNKYPDYTMLGIALECGFKSSSAFYSVLKKETGMTPKQFAGSLH